jgi:hypothetical protein
MERTAEKCYLVTSDWRKRAAPESDLLRVAEMLTVFAAVKSQHYPLHLL